MAPNGQPFTGVHDAFMNCPLAGYRSVLSGLDGVVRLARAMAGVHSVGAGVHGVARGVHGGRWR